MIDAMLEQATAVDGVTGEKGLAGYSAIAPRTWPNSWPYARMDPGFLTEMLHTRTPRLHDPSASTSIRWCLGRYYPQFGDTGSFAEPERVPRRGHGAGPAA